MIARRTFIARCSLPDGTVVLEDSLTQERVRVPSVDAIPGQIERWLETGEPGGERLEPERVTKQRRKRR